MGLDWIGVSERVNECVYFRMDGEARATIWVDMVGIKINKKTSQSIAKGGLGKSRWAKRGWLSLLHACTHENRDGLQQLATFSLQKSNNNYYKMRPPNDSFAHVFASSISSIASSMAPPPHPYYCFHCGDIPRSMCGLGTSGSYNVRTNQVVECDML